MIPQAVLMRSGIKAVNTAKPKDAHNVVKRNRFNAVKASACWVWMSKNRVVDHVSKNISASVTLKRLDYINAQGRFKIMAQITRPVGEPPSPSDRVQIQVDEIQNFVDGRSICPYEAFWRTFKFEIHSRNPVVQILCVHLKNIQVITFIDRQPLQFIANNDGKKMTTLTECLDYNKFYTDGRHLTYLDFPKHFVWYLDSKTWCPRRRPGQGSIGRLAHVVLYFRVAYEALGLLGDDKEWDTALMEACFLSTPTELRNLFAQFLIFYEVLDPLRL
ncbi:hypothetical protein Tco_1130330 [Tanacetum coccineum]